MASSNRSDRVAQVIQRELAQIIQREVKDPRMPNLVTVNAVKVTRDLQHAKVYVTFLDDDKDIEQGLEALTHTSGYLRHLLAERVKLRIMPQLHFVYDTSISYGNHMSGVLDNLDIPDQTEED